MQDRSKRQLVGMIVAGVLSVAFLLLAVNNINWRVFRDTFRVISLPAFLLFFVLSTIGYILRTLRWHILFSRNRSVYPLLAVHWANMVGYLGNSYLPGRAGEFLRSYLLGRRNESSVSFVFGTAVTERVVDLIVLVFGVGISLLFMPGQWLILSPALRNLVIIALAGSAAVFLLPGTKAWLFRRIYQLPLPERIKEKLVRTIDNFYEGLSQLRSGPVAGKFLLLTLLLWSLDAIGVMILAHLVHHPLVFQQAFFFLACLGAASALPSTPGAIGIYQFVAELVLVPFGFDRSGALAFSLILQAVGYATITFWGLIGLWYFRGDWPAFRRKATASDSPPDPTTPPPSL